MLKWGLQTVRGDEEKRTVVPWMQSARLKYKWKGGVVLRKNKCSLWQEKHLDIPGVCRKKWKEEAPAATWLPARGNKLPTLINPTRAREWFRGRGWKERRIMGLQQATWSVYRSSRDLPEHRAAGGEDLRTGDNAETRWTKRDRDDNDWIPFSWWGRHIHFYSSLSTIVTKTNLSPTFRKCPFCRD